MDVPPCHVVTSDGHIYEVDIDDAGEIILPTNIDPSMVVEFNSVDSASTTLSIHGLENLRKVIAIISFTEVICSQCPRLSSLELGDEVVDFRIDNCPSLTDLDLSDHLDLKVVTCWKCDSLATLKLPPNLHELTCVDCPQLHQLDLGTNSMIRHLRCNNCPSLDIIDLSGCRYLKSLRTGGIQG